MMRIAAVDHPGRMIENRRGLQTWVGGQSMPSPGSRGGGLWFNRPFGTYSRRDAHPGLKQISRRVI
jgi:hypothetical protein